MDNYKASLWHLFCKRDDGYYGRSLKKNVSFIGGIDGYFIIIVVYILHAPISLSFYLIFKLSIMILLI